MITNLTCVDVKRTRSRRVVGGRPRRRSAGHRPGIESLEERQLLTITANPDLFGVIEGNALTVAAPGVLANDSDSTKAVLQVSASTQPSHGSVTVASDGSFVYHPSANYTGTDSFTYTDSDGSGATATSTVNLDIFPYSQEATVFAGPRLASVSSTQRALLNTVLGGLLGTSLNLTAADWTGLASADLNGEQVADALAAELGVSSPSQALTTNATLLQIVNAAATVAQADGNTAEVSALDSLALDLPGLTSPVMLGNLLQVNPNDGSLVNTNLNALDLVTGAVQLYNFDNVLTTPTPITVSGSSLGLGSVINSVQVSAQVVEPPIITTGPAGTSFHSAAMRLALNLDLGNDPLNTSALTAGLLGPLQAALGPLASVTTNASLTNLSLYTEVASGQGIISAVDAIANSVTLQATPGLADVYLGNIPSSLFFNRNHVINPATDVGYGTVGSLGIDASLLGTTVANPTVGIQLKSTALGAAPSASTEVFNGPFPETQTVTTSAAFITNLANTLVNNLSVQLSGSLGAVLTPLTNTILPLVTSAVSTGVTPLVAPVLTGVADPALQLLGTGIGELILAVDGVSLIAAPIANPDFATTLENTPITIPVLDNDAFLPGDTIGITGTTAPAHGAVVVNPDGTITYTPTAGFLGSDAFTYTITDLDGLTSTASVTVAVTSPPPIANPDSYTAVSGMPLVVAAPGVLANDTDPAGLPLTSLLVSQPAHGTLALNSDGSFTYTPSAGYVGTDSFTYRDSDGSNFSDAALVTINVQAAPVTAVNDTYATTTDQPLVVSAPGILANDINPSGVILIPQLVTAPGHGSLTLNADGSFTYTPAIGFAGTDSFTYQDNDGTNLSNTATVTLIVNAVAPVPPTANPDFYTAISGVPLVVAAPGVLGNDTDPSMLPLTAIVATQPAHGTLTLNSDGSFTYTATAGYVGADSFTYRASDGAGISSPAEVSITVDPAPPVANNDAYSATSGVPLMIAAPGVLANDIDPDGLPLTAMLVSGPSNGMLIFGTNGSFNYTSTAGFVGTDSFTYRDSDGTNLSGDATVTFTVNPAPPVANPDSYTATSGVPLVIAAPGVLANDTGPAGFPLTAALVTNTTHGSLIFNGDGSFTYTPTAGYVGADSFTYRDSDGLSLSQPATVSFTVNAAPPLPPVARDDAYTATSGVPLVIAAPGILANDSDPSGRPLTAVLVSGPSHGTLTPIGNGSFTYTPTAGYVGTDSFTYRDNDGLNLSAVATVRLTVLPDVPVANPDFYTAISGIPLAVGAPGVLANDTDPAGLPLTPSVVTRPAHGTLTLNANGSFIYTPTAGYIGTDSFTYRDSDGTNLSGDATVTFTVDPAPPVANPDSYKATSGVPLVIAAPGVLANDFDPSGLPLTAFVVTQPAQGTLTFNPNGSFTYTPSASYVGTDSFTYRDSDQVNLSTAATVNFTVTAPPRVVQTFPVSGTVGTPLIRIPLLTFSDPGTFGSPLLSTVIISWGDGTPTSAGTITPFSGEYLVAGSHTYESPGTFPVIVTVDDPNNGSFTVVLPAFIKPLPTIGSLSGTVYNDMNGDGLYEPGKPGLAGQTVVLAGVDYLGNKVVMTTTTGPDGSYHFTGLSTGIYAMQETSFSVASLADVGSLGGVAGPNYVTSIAVVGNVAGTGYNFGERISSEIGGSVYLDANNNKQYDANEFGVANIPVTLTGTDLSGNRVYLTEVTAADGTYNFVGVAAGTYQIAIAQPPNFNRGQSNVGTAGGTAEVSEITGIDLPAGTDATGYDFGELIKSGCVLATPAYRTLLRYGPHPTGIPASAFKGLVVKPSNPIAFYLPTLTSEINNANSQAAKPKTPTKKAVKVVHAASVEELHPAKSVAAIRVAKPKVSKVVHQSARKT